MTIPQDRIDAAMKRLADGEPYRSVSRDTGFSTTLLHTRFKKAGLKRRKRPKSNIHPATLEGARLVVQEGLTYDAAAARVGKGKGTIWRAVNAGYGAKEGTAPDVR